MTPGRGYFHYVLFYFMYFAFSFNYILFDLLLFFTLKHFAFIFDCIYVKHTLHFKAESELMRIIIFHMFLTCLASLSLYASLCEF